MTGFPGSGNFSAGCEVTTTLSAWMVVGWRGPRSVGHRLGAVDFDAIDAEGSRGNSNTSVPIVPGCRMYLLT